MESLNERLAEVQKELDNANQSLSRLLNIDDYLVDDFMQAEIDYLLEHINILTKEFESLLQTL